MSQIRYSPKSIQRAVAQTAFCTILTAIRICSTRTATTMAAGWTHTTTIPTTGGIATMGLRSSSRKLVYFSPCNRPGEFCFNGFEISY